MSIARYAYTALAYAMLPRALLHLYMRGRREPAYRMHVAERFGRYGTHRGGDVIWIHAVSVGETRAAEPLVRAIRERFPGARVLLTHMTPTGRETGEELFGESVMRGYLPYDYPAAVARFLDHFRPRLGLIMETEVWPNLIHACAERRIPLWLVNARLSEKSFRGYSRVARLAREAFGGFAGMCAQTETDAARLAAFGARRVTVAGNLKFDVTPSPELISGGVKWRRAFAARSVFLAASTREGEEALLLDALRDVTIPNLLTIIVPRHPQRFDRVATLLAERGIRYVRRSSGEAITDDVEVVLGDTMGEMALYYAASDAAFIGGTLLAFGGQNLIEACAIGTPVIVGRYTYNFEDAAAGAVDAGAAMRIADARALACAATRILGDRSVREGMAARGREFTKSHQGATRRVLAAVTGVPAEASDRGGAPPAGR